MGRPCANELASPGQQLDAEVQPVLAGPHRAVLGLEPDPKAADLLTHVFLQANPYLLARVLADEGGGALLGQDGLHAGCEPPTRPSARRGIA